MKWLSVFTFLTLTFVSFTQDINFDKFSSCVINKINSYRESIGLDTLYYSESLEKNISSPNMKKMILSKKLFHPGYDIGNEILVSDITEEYEVLSKNIYSKENYLLNFIGLNGEICFSITADGLTCEDLASYALEGWLNSPPHKKTVETSFKNQNGSFGLFSCCVSKVNDEFFVVVNFVQFVYM
jgi:hypothetical protein